MHLQMISVWEGKQHLNVPLNILVLFKLEE